MRCKVNACELCVAGAMESEAEILGVGGLAIPVVAMLNKRGSGEKGV